MRWWTVAGIAAMAGGGVATEIVVARAGIPVDLALPDLAAGWSLLLAAGWARGLGSECRWWCAAAALLWFAATWGAVDTHAGHVAAQVATVWLAPLTVALLAAPGAWPAGLPSRAVAVLVGVRAAIPVLAAQPWVSLATGLALAAVALPGAARPIRFRWVRLATGGLGLAIAIAGGLDLIHRVPARPDLLVAGCVVACGISLATARPVTLARPGDAERLVIDLGRSPDARSQQQLLAVALGDPRVRLLYRLAPDLPFVDHQARPGSRAGAGREITVLSGPAQVSSGVEVALDHDSQALDDTRVRATVEAVCALLARRLQAAAGAASQAAEVAASRRRLVEAEDAERRRFARSVADGPGRWLEGVRSVLEDTLAEPGVLPAEVERTVRGALDQAVSAAEELVATVHGDLDRMLARDGLAAVLVELAAGVGAAAAIDPAVDDAIDGEPRGGPAGGRVARVAWFVAAEGLTNALRHAGAARLGLTARCSGGYLVIEVADDGIGGADPDGSGLSGLRLRAVELGGRLNVVPGPGGGTVLRAELPLRGAPLDPTSLSRPGPTGYP